MKRLVYMNDTKYHYSLEELYRDSQAKKIILPTIQRGFVWKAHQIENLWDSLLRGYPIGAFVVTAKEENCSIELLDGQQRASAICLGFYNPLLESQIDVFKTSNEKIMVFIDLENSDKSKNDNRKYVFRVITKSHPWGYQKIDNQKTLDSKHINEALTQYFKSEHELFDYNYRKEPLKRFWPFNSTRAIPIGIFVDAALKKKSIQDLEADIKKWQCSTLNYLESKNKDLISISEIYNDVQSMLKYQKIPLSYLNFEKILNNQSDDIIIDNDEYLDNVENLFIRLNAGGTPLGGEELNYSILKTRISTNTQKEIEDSCKGFIRPSRFVTLIFQLFKNRASNSSNDKQSSNISLKVSPRQFQKEMGDYEEFEKFIKGFIASNCINKALETLSYKHGDDCGLPAFIFNHISIKAPEVLFILLYRYYIKKDQINDVIRPNVLGVITLLSWLGKGEDQRDHSKLLRNIWYGAKNFNMERFWSHEIIQLGMRPYLDRCIIPPIPNKCELKSIFKESGKINSLSYSNIVSNSDYSIFIENIFFNKELILFAQRQVLKQWFEDVDEQEIEDSNVPFDWDHISPQSLVSNQRGVRNELKEWYQSIGNFRAWPYSLNRSDNDSNPEDKFNPEEKNVWVEAYLNKFDIKFSELSQRLLKDSFCSKEWAGLNYYRNGKTKDTKKRINNSKNAKAILKQILKRNIQLCEHWYDKLYIEKLVPQKVDVIDVTEIFTKKLNLRYWRLEGGGDYHIFERVLLVEDQIYLFLNIQLETALNENAIEFGIRNSKEGFEILKISGSNTNNYQKDFGDEYDYIFNAFTLTTFSKESLNELFEEFRKWLYGLPKNGLNKDKIISKFKTGLKE